MRDLLLKREKANPDIDFAVSKGAINFAREVSCKLKGGFVVLDKEHGCARIVKKISGRNYTLDFSDFRNKAKAIEKDLFHRDFTINSLAVELSDLFKTKNFKQCLIDPYQGVKDIQSKIIRMVNPDGFDDDPLRILRGFSLSAIFGFEIDKKTLKTAVKKRKKITSVSGERIRDEIFKILASPKAYESIKDLNKHKILELIIPEIKPMQRLKQGPYHHLDVWGHSLETVKNLELIIKSFSKNLKISDYLNTEISSGRTRLELLKFVALLHDIGKPKTLRIEKGKLKFYGHETVGSYMIRNICQRLKLSNEETRVLRQITFCHLRPGYLADAMTPRAKFRFFRDTAVEAASVLLVSLADQRSTKGVLTTKDSRQRHERLVRKLLKEYFKEQDKEDRPKLINGHDLIKHFKLIPSPLVGKILKEIEELQAIGKINDKTEALKAAAKIICALQKNRSS